MKQAKRMGGVLGVVLAVAASMASAQSGSLGGQPVPDDAFKPRVVRPVPDGAMYLAFPPFQRGAVWTCDAFQNVQPDVAKAKMAEAGVDRVQVGDVAIQGLDGVARPMSATVMMGPSGPVAVVPDSGVYREACVQ